MSTKHFNPSGQLLPVRQYRNKLWIPYAIVVVLVLALCCFQIYRISTGKVESAVPLKSNQLQSPDKRISRTVTKKKVTNKPQVDAVLNLQQIDPKSLGGNNERVTFRSLGGEIACTIATDLDKNPPKLVPVPISSSGTPASGVGAVCGSVHEFTKPGAEPIAQCRGRKPLLGVIGVWNGDQKSIGICNGDRTPLHWDARGKTDNFQGARFALKVLGAGQYTQIGDYACGFVGSSVQCVNVKTGAGFKYTDMIAYEYF